MIPLNVKVTGEGHRASQTLRKLISIAIINPNAGRYVDPYGWTILMPIFHKCKAYIAKWPSATLYVVSVWRQE